MVRQFLERNTKFSVFNNAVYTVLHSGVVKKVNIICDHRTIEIEML